MIRLAVVAITLLSASFVTRAGGRTTVARAAGRITPAFAPVRALIAEPQVGVSGQTVYVSGCCYLPNQTMSLLLACPFWFTPDVGRLNNFIYRGVVRTDDNGSFAGFALSGFQLHGLRSSPCRVYAAYAGPTGESDFVDDAPAPYFIAASHSQVPKLSRHIGGHVTASVGHMKSRLVENVHIRRGWGGALAVVKVTFAHGNTLTYVKRLDWVGQADIHVPLSASAAHVDHGQIAVKFRLGAFNGFASASFRMLR